MAESSSGLLGERTKRERHAAGNCSGTASYCGKAPHGPLKFQPPGAEKEQVEESTLPDSGLRPAPEFWGSVGLQDTTPSGRQSVYLQDVLNNIGEIPRS